MIYLFIILYFLAGFLWLISYKFMHHGRYQEEIVMFLGFLLWPIASLITAIFFISSLISQSADKLAAKLKE